MSDTDERMDAARFLIVNGRSWLDLDEKQIAHGARCIIRDPIYRKEICNTAIRHAGAIKSPGLMAQIRLAWDLLKGPDDA
jgi:hypothetical protein